MLHASDFGNIEQTPESFIVKHFAIWRKARAEFKGQHLRIAVRSRLIGGGPFSSGLAVQSRRLKHDGNTANIGNGIHLLAIERDDIATIMFDKSARNERNVAAESFPGPAQHVAPFCGAEKIHIASIHV